MRVWLACLLLLPLGCDLYSSDDVCQQGAYGDLTPTAGSLRNPQTGSCEPLPEGSCGLAQTQETNALLPDWAACGSYCEALDQQVCATTAGCRVIMQETCPPNVDCGGLSPIYAACWAIAPSGPDLGDCTGLAAQGCSRHDNCIAVHASNFADCADPKSCGSPPLGDFATCIAEP